VNNLLLKIKPVLSIVAEVYGFCVSDVIYWHIHHPATQKQGEDVSYVCHLKSCARDFLGKFIEQRTDL